LDLGEREKGLGGGRGWEEGKRGVVVIEKIPYKVKIT